MSRRTQKNVGLIGLGIIGRRVADNLRRRGFHVFVWNRTPRPYPNFVGSPAELAELCDFVQIFVSDDAALLDMVQQMKPSLHVQHVIMAHSTVAPHTMRNAAEIVKRRGAQFLDAPFTGSKIPAEKGELVYYVAGDDAAYRRARPVLEASSKEIIEIGEIGQATTVKIATNMVTAATVQAAAEALALVHNSGLALDKFAVALRGNASNSGTLAMKLPKMIEGDFDAHFSVKHMLKDVQIAARMARSYGLTLGATEAARDSLLEEANSGRADLDFSSLIRSLFPEGLPSEQADEEAEDAQQKLNGVEEEADAQVAREEQAAARRGPTENILPEVRARAVPEEEADEREEPSREEEPVADRNGDRPAEGGADEPTAAASTQTAEEDEPRAAVEEPQVRETEEPAVSASEESETDAGEKRDGEPELSSPPTSETDDDDKEPASVAPAAEPDAERDEPAAVADEAPETSADRDPEPAGETAPEPEPRAEEEEPAPAEPVTSATPEPEPRAAEATADDLSGEPPRERRVTGEREPEPRESSPEQEDVAARRSFLSRMFGKGSEY